VTRFLLRIPLSALLALLLTSMFPVRPAAQAAPQRAEPIKSGEVPGRKHVTALPPRGTFVPPKTPWGDPDIAGDYNNSDESGIPFEKPDEFKGRRMEDITPAELAKLVQQRQEQTIERTPGLSEFPGATSPMHWFENYYAANSRVWLVTDPMAVPQITGLGPDALSLSREGLEAALSANTGRIKTVITDQKVIAGIGNAYSDEILHVAKLSPFATANKLTEAQLAALHDAMISVLTDAVTRSVGQQAATLKGEKRSGLRVHARTGLPCPVCGDTVREVSFADKSFQYCPTCQTGGKILADRRMSRLLK